MLQGEERAAAWERTGAQVPGHAAYQRSTDREIPIVRLTPEESAPPTKSRDR